MIKRPEIGKIYDTLFFCIRYFNEQTVEFMINNYSDTSFMSECYQEINAEFPSLPPVFQPLFYFKNQSSSALSGFFVEYVDYKEETIDSFLNKITEKSDIIYAKAFDSLFPAYSDTQDSVHNDYFDALERSDYSDNFKLQIALLFGNFSHVISMLTEQLLQIYRAVERLHKKNSSILSDAHKQINTRRNVQIYNQMLRIGDCVHSDKYYCSVSLLHQYITLLTYTDGTQGILLGYRHEEAISSLLKERDIDFRKLLVAIGNDTRLEIIKALEEQKELTATEIAKVIDVPLTTVLRHTYILYNSGVLFVSKKKGLQIFYRININLLANAFKLLSYKMGEL